MSPPKSRLNYSSRKLPRALPFEALDIFRQALEFYRKIEAKKEEADKLTNIFASYGGLGQSYEGLGHSHTSKKFYKKAKKNYLKAISLLEKIYDSLLPGQRIRFFEAKIFGFSI